MGFQSQPIIDFIGKGITFPIQLNANGTAILSTGFPLIESSMQMILNWTGGQVKRFFLGEYDSRLNELLEEPNDDVLMDLVETLIKDALDKWEPRIQLITVDGERIDESKIDVTVIYQIKNTQSQNSFVFPFYTKIIY